MTEPKASAKFLRSLPFVRKGPESKNHSFTFSEEVVAENVRLEGNAPESSQFFLRNAPESSQVLEVSFPVKNVHEVAVGATKTALGASSSFLILLLNLVRILHQPKFPNHLSRI